MTCGEDTGTAQTSPRGVQLRIFSQVLVRGHAQFAWAASMREAYARCNGVCKLRAAATPLRLGKSNRETLGCPAEARPSEPSPRGSNPLPEPLTISRRTRTSHPSLVELAFRMLKMEPCPDTSLLMCRSSSSEPSAHALENASRS